MQAAAIQCADTHFPPPLSSLQGAFQHAGLWVNSARWKTLISPFVRRTFSDFAKPLISTQKEENKSLYGFFRLIEAIYKIQWGLLVRFNHKNVMMLLYS